MTNQRIVLMVQNAVLGDSRVLKTASVAAQTGAEVTVLGISPTEVAETFPMDDFTVLRLPITRKLIRHGRSVNNAARYGVMPLTYPDTSSKQAEAIRLKEMQKYRKYAFPGSERIQIAINETQRVHNQRVGAASLDHNAEQVNASWLGSQPDHWSRVLWEVIEYNSVLLPALRDLNPDGIHLHDAMLLATVSLYVREREVKGSPPWFIYDAHELVPGMSVTDSRLPHLIRAYTSLEEDFAGVADQMITVSPALARNLKQRLSLPKEPSVIYNCPPLNASRQPCDRNLRQELNLAPNTPLMVYSGILAPGRGVDLAMDALSYLPEVHLAIICVPSMRSHPAEVMRGIAEKSSQRDRIHFLDPVAPEQVASYLKEADVGLLPLRDYPSHSVALTNKLFEYAFAGLPVVASDLPAQAEFIKREQIGEIFEPENAVDLARAVTKVLDNYSFFTSRVESDDFRNAYCWEKQQDELAKIYAQMTRNSLFERFDVLAETLASVSRQAQFQNKQWLAKSFVSSCYSKAVRPNATSTEFIYMAQDFTEIGDTEGARNAFRQSHLLAPQSLSVLRSWVALEWQAGEHSTALELLLRARDIDPDDADLQVLHARLLAAQEDFTTALAVLDALEGTHPGHRDAAAIRSRILALQARDFLHESEVLEPEPFPQSLFPIAEINEVPSSVNARNRDPQPLFDPESIPGHYAYLARVHFLQSVNLHRGAERSSLLAEWSHFEWQLGNAREALNLGLKARLSHEPTLEIDQHLVEMYLALGMTSDATHLLADIDKRYPESPYARELCSALECVSNH